MDWKTKNRMKMKIIITTIRTVIKQQLRRKQMNMRRNKVIRTAKAMPRHSNDEILLSNQTKKEIQVVALMNSLRQILLLNCNNSNSSSRTKSILFVTILRL